MRMKSKKQNKTNKSRTNKNPTNTEYTLNSNTQWEMGSVVLPLAAQLTSSFLPIRKLAQSHAEEAWVASSYSPFSLAAHAPSE